MPDKKEDNLELNINGSEKNNKTKSVCWPVISCTFVTMQQLKKNKTKYVSIFDKKNF